MDAAAPAAFLALLAPRIRGREPWALALAAALAAIITTPLVPPGVPILIAAAVGVAFGLRPGALAGRPASPADPGAADAFRTDDPDGAR
jgi:predicted branched-subunit amino acid permease